MYKHKEVGKYNVDFEGMVYDNKIPYQMVIIEEFDGNIPVKDSRKVLYFRAEIGYIMPEFKTEKAVKTYLKYKNHSKLQVVQKIIIEEVK